MELINQDGEMQTLVQKGENYQYQSEKPLKDGSYWVTATYKPTFWSQNNEGWKMDKLTRHTKCILLRTNSNVW